MKIKVLLTETVATPKLGCFNVGEKVEVEQELAEKLYSMGVCQPVLSDKFKFVDGKFVFESVDPEFFAKLKEETKLNAENTSGKKGRKKGETTDLNPIDTNEVK